MAAQLAETMEEPLETETEVYTNKTEFLNAIHLNFLINVHPIESGLVDILRSHYILDSGDEQTINAEVTRRDKARTCWKLMGQVPSNVFQQSCYPALQETCSFAVRGKTFNWDGQREALDHCLRHQIPKRMTLGRFADVFPGTRGCSPDEYNEICEGNDRDVSLWDKAFQLCTRNKDNAACMEMMKTSLERHQVTLLDTFDLMLIEGFPCTCPCPASPSAETNEQSPVVFPPSNKLPSDVARHETQTTFATQLFNIIQSLWNKFWVSKTKEGTAESSVGYPSLVDATPDGDEGYSVSVCSHESLEMNSAEDEDQDYRFETQEQKQIALKQLEEIDTAIVKASKVKVVYRKVSGIQERLTMIMHETKSGTSERAQIHDLGKYMNLYTDANKLTKRLERDFEQVSAIQKRADEAVLNMELPFHHKTTLMKKKQVLDNEMKEASLFFKQSLDICNGLRTRLQISPSC